MSLYGALFGGDRALGDRLAAVLGYSDASAFGRFRDCWVETDGDEPLIAIHTRNGGGNRDCWNTPESEDGETCDCVGCLQTHVIPAHPLYVRDEDDDFDCTYCTTWFRVPEKLKAEMQSIAVERPDIGGRWQSLFEALRKSN